MPDPKRLPTEADANTMLDLLLARAGGGIPGALEAAWNRPSMSDKSIDVYGEQMPIPEAPAAFRPRAQVVGSRLADAMRPIYKLAPQLEGKIRKIQFGPGDDVIRLFQEENVAKRLKGLKSDLWNDPVNEFGQSNLMGLTNMRTKNININPTLEGADLNETLAHEASHAAGYHDESIPTVMGQLFKALMQRGGR